MENRSTEIIAELARRGFQLRAIAPTDAPGLADFHTRLSERSQVLFTPHHFDLATLEKVCARFAQMRHDQGFVLADSAGRIAAYFFLWNIDCAVPELGIAIADEFQGRGLGKLLMHFLIEAGRALGKKQLRLTTGVHNDNAFALYTKCGFVYTQTIEVPDGPGGKPFLQKELIYTFP